MNRLLVSLLAIAFAFGAASARGDDLPTKAQPQTPKEKAKAVDRATGATDAGEPVPGRPVHDMGGFSPHYGTPIDQWREQQKRRQERQEQARPRSSDEERAERKRLVDEWEKTQPPIKPAAK